MIHKFIMLKLKISLRQGERKKLAVGFHVLLVNYIVHVIN